MSESRITKTFARLEAEGKGGFVAYVMAGDPDYATSFELVKQLPEAGVDIIELGIPFTDPMADGPAIQAAGQRALAGGQTLAKTLQMVRDFRSGNEITPIVLMGYYNPIYIYGVDRFLADAKEAGVDGLIIVDLPPEEDEELCLPAVKAGIHFIRLATPTTDEARLPAVLANTSGFLYYVAVAGITGQKSAEISDLQGAIARLRAKTELPIAIGFGIKSPEQAQDITGVANAAVVGSAIVAKIEDGLLADGEPGPNMVSDVLAFTAALADGAHKGQLKE